VDRSCKVFRLPEPMEVETYFHKLRLNRRIADSPLLAQDLNAFEMEGAGPRKDT
jgi:hypothetical protein